MKSALIIVDMVNDFVTGKFGSKGAVEVLKRLPRIINNAEGKMEVVFTLDTHISDDPEFKVWGEHCLMGTRASELAPELEGFAGYRIRKRHYDAFFDTDLDGFLRARGVSILFICGVSTDICVQHTVSGAFFRNYEINVIKNLCAAIDPKRHEESLSFMERNYHAKLINDSELLVEVN
jgi:nicotinamidase-related amidase